MWVAAPLSHLPGVSPFTISAIPSSNTFSAFDVARRWEVLRAVFSQAGLRLLVHSSDGDPKLVTSMLAEYDLPIPESITTPPALSQPYLVFRPRSEYVTCEDPLHTLMKCFNTCRNPAKLVVMGKAFVQQSMLETLLHSLSMRALVPRTP